MLLDENDSGLTYLIYFEDKDLWTISTNKIPIWSVTISKYAMRFLIKYAKANGIKWAISERHGRY